MFGDIKPNWELDFEHYEKLVKERELYTNTELRDRLVIIYKKIYLYTTLTSGITILDNRSKIEDFFNECKNNLIISYDLANVNYINASKQILRSAIESFFRLSLAISKYIEYKENKKKGVFSVTTSLHDLKSMQESHKVGRLTRFVIDYYKDTPVEGLYLELYNLYSDLSGVVHVNKKENFTPHKYLSDYIDYNEQLIESQLSHLEMVIDSVIQIIYYFSYSLIEERIEFKKRDLLEFESTLNTTYYLDLIQSNFATYVPT